MNGILMILFFMLQNLKMVKKQNLAPSPFLHNGVLVQDHFTLEGTTEYIGWPKNEPHGKAPIKLQDHNDQSGVSFRNIWVRELD